MSRVNLVGGHVMNLASRGALPISNTVTHKERYIHTKTIGINFSTFRFNRFSPNY